MCVRPNARFKQDYSSRPFCFSSTEILFQDRISSFFIFFIYLFIIGGASEAEQIWDETFRKDPIGSSPIRSSAPSRSAYDGRWRPDDALDPGTVRSIPSGEAAL